MAIDIPPHTPPPVFYSGDNIKMIYSVIKPIFDFIDDSQLKKLLFDIMTKINKEHHETPTPLFKLNSLVIDELQSYITKKCDIPITKQIEQIEQNEANEPVKFIKCDEHPPVIQKTFEKRLSEKYINISSQDRVWFTPDETFRYSYKVNLNNRHRQIQTIQVGKVIIPDEIIQLYDPIKQTFNDNFQFGFQYLMLQIDQFSDVYDGSNQIINDCFCKLIFHRSYRTQQGRGYVILKPEQNERKVFYPTLLSELNNLFIRILKPNGQLFNKSQDNYNILNVTYLDPVTLPEYLMITTTTFFDINVFYPGDLILIKQFALMNNIDFINGDHEILKIGNPNSNMFYNSFYIKTKGFFDSSTGSYIVDHAFLSTLNLYNSSSPSPSGKLLNVSLQNSVSMKLEMVVDELYSNK